VAVEQWLTDAPFTKKEIGEAFGCMLIKGKERQCSK
jgi:hypothetical protein